MVYLIDYQIYDEIFYETTKQPHAVRDVWQGPNHNFVHYFFLAGFALHELLTCLNNSKITLRVVLKIIR